MNHHILQRTLKRFRQPFLADFHKLTDKDVHTILTGSSETLLAVFHKQYGYTRAQAIRAWNEFVLRHVDGEPTKPTSRPSSNE